MTAVKETLVIWTGIILLIATLIFPPYGYTKTIFTFHSTDLGLDDQESN